jgi:RNA polymerase sigma-70 factor, ECF subfamily
MRFPQRSVQTQPLSDTIRAKDALVNRGDVDLVRRAQSGDRGAFDLLVLKYWPRVLSVARRYAHSQVDAEDVSQEAFINAFLGLRHFRFESSFYTWLHRIAVNAAFTAARSREQRDAIGVPGTSEPDELSSKLRDLDTPEELMHAELVRKVIEVSLAALPATQRAALLLREHDGLSYGEIAARMRTSTGTVRSRIFRARQAIDRQLRLVAEGGVV